MVGSVSSIVRTVVGAILGVAFIWLRYTDSVPEDDKSIYIVGVIGIFILVVVFPSYFKSSRIAKNAPTNMSYDVSDRGILPSNPGAQQIISQLNRMGFTRLGETGTKVPGVGEGITWLLGNPGRTILAEVVETQNGLCQFSTVYQDLAVIETSFPIGEHINKENYYSRKSTESLDEAYKLHVRDAKALTTTHGRPRSIKSMDALLKWEKIYRERYVNYKINTKNSLNTVLRFVLILAALAAATFFLQGQ